jgi:hypothetical protein
VPPTADERNGDIIASRENNCDQNHFFSSGRTVLTDVLQYQTKIIAHSRGVKLHDQHRKPKTPIDMEAKTGFIENHKNWSIFSIKFNF